MPDVNPFEEYGKKQLPELLQALGKTSIESSGGKNTLNFLQSLISVKTTEMVNEQLAEKTKSISKSASIIKHAFEANAENISNSARKIESQILSLRDVVTKRWSVWS